MNDKNIQFRSLSEQQKKQVSQIQKLLPITTTKNPTTFILLKDIKQEHRETGFEFIGYDNNRQIFKFEAERNKEPASKQTKFITAINNSKNGLANYPDDWYKYGLTEEYDLFKTSNPERTIRKPILINYGSLELSELQAIQFAFFQHVKYSKDKNDKDKNGIDFKFIDKYIIIYNQPENESVKTICKEFEKKKIEWLELDLELDFRKDAFELNGILESTIQNIEKQELKEKEEMKLQQEKELKEKEEIRLQQEKELAEQGLTEKQQKITDQQEQISHLEDSYMNNYLDKEATGDTTHIFDKQCFR